MAAKQHPKKGSTTRANPHPNNNKESSEIPRLSKHDAAFSNRASSYTSNSASFDMIKGATLSNKDNKHRTTVPYTPTAAQPASSSSSSSKPTTPGIWARYNRLPLRWKLYLGISTFITVYITDSVSSKIMENNMVDYEAERRTKLELEKLKQSPSNTP